MAEVCDPDRTKISEEDFTLKTRRKVSLRQLMLIERQKVLIYIYIFILFLYYLYEERLKLIRIGTGKIASY